MTALLLSLGASLAWGVSDFTAGSAGRRRDPIVVLLLMRLGGLAAIVLLTVILVPPWVGDRWPLAVGAGLLSIVGGITTVRALAIGPMGVTAPIVAASGAVPAVVGLFTGDALDPLTLAGLAVACAGAGLASRAPGHDGERVSGAGVAYALTAAVVIGVALLLVHAAAEEALVTSILLQRVTDAGLLLLGVVVLRARGRIRPFPVSPSIVGAGVLETLAITAFAAAASLGSLAVAAVLSSLYPVVTVLMARSFHHERLSRPQTVGAALTLAGVALVVVGGG